MSHTRQKTLAADLSGNGEGVALRGSVREHSSKNAYVVTPDDANDLPVFARALFIEATGTVSLIPVGTDTAIDLASQAAGTVIPIQTRRVNSTSTTATVVALV